jgi:pyruvate dehydrogenase E1 component
MGEDALKAFRTRFDMDLTDEQVHEKAFVRPPEDAPEMRYLHERRRSSAATCPPAPTAAARSRCRGSDAFKTVRAASCGARTHDRWRSSRVLSALAARQGRSASGSSPIVADESRTFGMEGMFRQLGIFSQVGQLYQPEDADQLMYYKEDKKGQILQEGINEAGAMSSWIAAATSYANHGEPMIPFYVYYSMFGFQRVGDLAWAARTRARAASSSAAPRGARRSTARACSTRTATRTCGPRRSRTASPTTPPTATRSRSSSRTACGGCTPSRRTSSTT